MCRKVSDQQCDQIWRKLKIFWQIYQGLFCVGQNLETNLEKICFEAKFLCFEANFHCCKWPNIEK